MSLPVHLVPTLTGVVEGSLVEVTGDEAHHAVAVRRLAVGEQVVLTDGSGVSVTGAVESTGKRVFVVAVDSVAREEPASPRFTVVQAIPKGDRGELAVEVLTEIGAAEIVPWAASRSVAVWRGERAVKSHGKWVSTAREAAKQARRSWFPLVPPMATTAQVVGLIREADLAVVLHEEGPESFSSLDVPASGSIVVVVGPEGGISPEELAAFADAGVQGVKLGDEVLRTSTAGVAAVAALLSRTPRWA
ncbi:16S rRNA (uracil(1498)-N(3))-methyltransferase [Nocardioides jiangxiensis]|uniref:Ribosomal RNA small subunit methyltransferase E n=1 Tax=Nocardioides jiangxiensis TaxID=3064524 RepID=A0ABT9B1Z3_9ACTN|nr:16S rRNA (uracil(1498)-N(3))-methyltransferase [Nocardioides sp. WY-20]MDO7867183.1 16S rRNA (uracil(1498)-N(3))-methyltransferase [Nocardioides sp. WY-20]